MSLESQYNRRDILKAGVGAILLPTIIAKPKRGMAEMCETVELTPMNGPVTVSPEGPLGFYQIRPEFRKDPTLPFAIHYLDEMYNKYKDSEFEFYFYEKSDGWCIKFHNFENRKKITGNPGKIYNRRQINHCNCNFVKFEDGFTMPLIKDDNNLWPKSDNILIVEHHGLINGVSSAYE